MNRAYGLFQLKEFDEGTGILTGIATSINPDRMGDIVEPKGALFELPLPLLAQHRSDSPVGHVVEAKVSEKSIEISAQLVDPEKAKSETVKERLLAAWDDVKLGLTRGLSIGFNALESSRIENTWSYHFLSWEWLELSFVTIPANADATIIAVKNFARRPEDVSRLDPELLAKHSRPKLKGSFYL